MRIVGGRFGGRKLAALGKGDAKNALRPTSDRLREALFNILGGGRFGDVLSDAQVLDVFAGTGALGLEALSRGAAHCTFVETGRTSQRVLQENLALCSAQSTSHILRKDATKLGPCTIEPATLAFLDPPYGRGLGEKALRSAQEGGWLAKSALVVWEEMAPMAAPEGFALFETRTYGSTTFTFLGPAE